MAWTESRAFRQYFADLADNTTAMDFVTDASVKAALYNNTGTPDRDVSAANSAYNVGQWVTGNEVIDASGWPAGGQAVGSRTITTPSTGVVMYDAADTASANSNTTLASVYGCLVYDDTIASPVADQGFSYHYFGGTQSVTAGTFTVVWHANGLMRITV